MVSTYDWFGYDIPIKKRYQLIKEAGFDGVLMWWSNGFGRGEDYRNGPEYARNSELYIENIHTPVQHSNELWLDNLDGEDLLDCYLECISDCSKFEIPTMVIHLPDENNPYNEKSLDRIKRITERAEKLEINVAMENLWNLTNLKYVLDHIKSERIGFCYDCCHHYNYFAEVNLLEMYGARMMAMHMHDNGGERRQHQLPFDGRIHWNEVMKNISKTGYMGSTALEPMNWDYMNFTAEEFLRMAYEKVKQLEIMRYEHL